MGIAAFEKSISRLAVGAVAALSKTPAEGDIGRIRRRGEPGRAAELGWAAVRRAQIGNRPVLYSYDDAGKGRIGQAM